MKILIADDSRVMRQIVVRTMRQAGFQHVQIGALMPLLVSLLCVHLVASLIGPAAAEEGRE